MRCVSGRSWARGWNQNFFHLPSPLLFIVKPRHQVKAYPLNEEAVLSETSCLTVFSEPHPLNDEGGESSPPPEENCKSLQPQTTFLKDRHFLQDSFSTHKKARWTPRKLRIFSGILSEDGFLDYLMESPLHTPTMEK